MNPPQDVYSFWLFNSYNVYWYILQLLDITWIRSIRPQILARSRSSKNIIHGIVLAFHLTCIRHAHCNRSRNAALSMFIVNLSKKESCHTKICLENVHSVLTLRHLVMYKVMAWRNYLTIYIWISNTGLDKCVVHVRITLGDIVIIPDKLVYRSTLLQKIVYIYHAFARYRNIYI